MTEDVKKNVISIIKAIYLIEKVVGSQDDEARNPLLERAVDFLNGVNSRLCDESELKRLVVEQINGFKKAEFRRWLTKEVLPTIRKTGSYIHNPKTAVLIGESFEDLGINLENGVEGLDADECTVMDGEKPKMVNESGFYHLAFKSNVPASVAFRDWVFGEVLPAILETGHYTHTKDSFHFGFVGDPTYSSAKDLFAETDALV